MEMKKLLALVQRISWIARVQYGLILTSFILLAVNLGSYAMWPLMVALGWLYAAKWFAAQTPGFAKFHWHWPALFASIVLVLIIGPFPICGPGGCSAPEPKAPAVDYSERLDQQLGAADSCAGYPFCLLQHGYCAENCTSARVCDPTGCQVDISDRALSQAIDQHGLQAVSGLLNQLRTQNNHQFNFEDADSKKCDNRRCNETYGWPWCYLCSE